jgi:hypothetical protein
VQLTPLQRTVNAPRSARRGVGSHDGPAFANRVAAEQHDGEGQASWDTAIDATAAAPPPRCGPGTRGCSRPQLSMRSAQAPTDRRERLNACAWSRPVPRPFVLEQRS